MLERERERSTATETAMCHRFFKSRTETPTILLTFFTAETSSIFAETAETSGFGPETAPLASSETLLLWLR